MKTLSAALEAAYGAPVQRPAFLIQIGENGALPVANFVGLPLLGAEPLEVAFTNLSTNATSYVWDFGDGSPVSTEVNPTKTYAAVGKYTVTLTATGPEGSDGETKIEYIEVTAAGVNCGDTIVMVKQGKGAGGVLAGDGMVQAGPAVTARNAFLASLQSYVSANMSHVTASNTIKYCAAPGGIALPLWSGAGSLRSNSRFDINSKVVNASTDPALGRFNTSEAAPGNWYVNDSNFTITLTSAKTAFFFNIQDVGDFNARIDFSLFLAGAHVRTISLPTEIFDNAGAGETMFVGFQNGQTPFDSIFVRIWQEQVAPNDGIGFDNIGVGDAVTCIPVTLPSTFSGINTAADAAKTVVGAALTARNNFLAAIANAKTETLEAQATGTTTTRTLTFTGGSGTATATAFAAGYNADGSGTSSDGTRVRKPSTITTASIAQRWNTTAAGSKYLEFAEELDILFSSPILAFGCYLTNIGESDTTVRFIFQRADGTAVAHYAPKAAALGSPSGLLRFFGALENTAFVRVIIRVIYYRNLTLHDFAPQVYTTSQITIAVDDLVIGS